MRLAATIAAVWLAFSVAALLVGWRISTIRRRYENELDAEALVIEEAMRVVLVEQSRLNHPSQRGRGADRQATAAERNT